MRKAIILLLAASFAGAIYFLSHNNQDKCLIKNVEALSQTEHGSYIRCYQNVKSDPADSEIYCGTCEALPARAYSAMSFCRP